MTREQWKELGDLYRDTCERRLLEKLSDGAHYLYGDQRALVMELMERGWVEYGMWHSVGSGYTYQISYAGRRFLADYNELLAELKVRYDAAKRAVWRYQRDVAA